VLALIVEAVVAQVEVEHVELAVWSGRRRRRHHALAIGS
jgi:hypothetical protein